LKDGATIRSLIEQSTIEINDSINFNHRVFSQRGHDDTQWFPEEVEPKTSGAAEEKATVVPAHVCKTKNCCLGKTADSFF
jgi:hypothetical protein